MNKYKVINNKYIEFIKKKQIHRTYKIIAKQ